MNIKDVRLAKKKILKCLTEDFDYGTNKKTGKPLKRKKKNYALFDRRKGYQVFNGTDLEMVMDAIILGLYLAMDESTDN